MRTFSCLLLPTILLGCFLPILANDASGVFEISSGAATFEASTNVPGVEVKGKSNALSGHLTITRDERGLTLEGIDVVLPVKNLNTGMNVRDEHMRKYIFTTSDSQVPDLHFTANTIQCPAKPDSQELTCRITGDLSIRGAGRPFAMNLNVKAQPGSTPSFRGTGDAVVRLSDYGIAAPSQFGVTAGNEVKLHLDFAARRQPTSTSSVRRAQ